MRKIKPEDKLIQFIKQMDKIILESISDKPTPISNSVFIRKYNLLKQEYLGDYYEY
jgi:hypothetical protein